MIDKYSGNVAYAGLAFGGFLRMGDKHHPLPWDSLKYDTNLDGYVVNIDASRLENAPSYDAGTTPDWENDTWRTGVDNYYASNR
jgi:hypothetical protein